MLTARSFAISLVAITLSVSCGGDSKEWKCLLAAGDNPDSVRQLGCQEDFLIVASQPLDSSIPGARSGKTVIDRIDQDKLYFQNSKDHPDRLLERARTATQESVSCA